MTIEVVEVMSPDDIVMLLEALETVEAVEVEFTKGGVEVEGVVRLDIVVDDDDRVDVEDEKVVVKDAAGGSTEVEEGVAEAAKTPGPDELEAGITSRQEYPESVCE